MFSTFPIKTNAPPPSPQEGDLYKTVTVEGQTFHLYYGYYEDFERNAKDSEPLPIYPDFSQAPLYTDEGLPFVTAMQDPCQHYRGRKKGDSCQECRHFQAQKELFGLCLCQDNRKPPTVTNE